MKVATFNINSIRKRIEPLAEWLQRNRPDVLCLQETKVQDVDFPVAAFEPIGYHCSFRGMKSHAGVATLTLERPSRVVHGLDGRFEEDEARVLLTVVRGIPILNTYVPQGQKVGSDKYARKLQFFDDLRAYFDRHLRADEPAVWTGDLNVAPEPIDVYHPDRRASDPDFHIDAREAYKRAAGWGWIDTFRALHPERVQYTYWDYFRNAFQNNWGWRIDHILATKPLAERCRAADVDLEPRRGAVCSDHTVAWAEFDV